MFWTGFSSWSMDVNGLWHGYMIYGIYGAKSQPKLQPWMFDIPSGKRLHNYGKSPCLMGKSTISTGPFSIAFCMFTGGYVLGWLKQIDRFDPQGPFYNILGEHLHVHLHFVYLVAWVLVV